MEVPAGAQIDEDLLMGLDEEDEESAKSKPKVAVPTAAKSGSLYPTLPLPASRKETPAPRKETPAPREAERSQHQRMYPALPTEPTPPRAQAPAPKREAAGRRNEAADSESEEEADDVPLEEDELAQCWFEVFEQVGLPRDACERYALGFSRSGVDDSNAGELSDADLSENGITDAQHRATILHLIQALVSRQQQAEEGEARRLAAERGEVSWEDVERAERTLKAQIDKVDGIEARIAAILAGDTDRQRAFHARLAEERAKREAAREESRRKRALRRAKRTLDRVKADLGDA